jgi:hypothetical protein
VATEAGLSRYRHGAGRSCGSGINSGGGVEHSGLDDGGVAMAVAAEDVCLAEGRVGRSPSRGNGGLMSLVFYLPDILLRTLSGLPLAEEPRLFVEDGSQTVVTAEDKYQALAEEEGHQAVAAEDVCSMARPMARPMAWPIA